MKNQKCPACGAALENHMTVCPDCGLDGLDQFFLSKEAYLDWYEREVIPQQDRIRKPQVFAGARHFLILLGSGDLYAVGDNRSDACGVDLPRELTEPVRIARNVKHAAAGENHTVYITQDKEVKIIGNSDLADRFRCDLRAEYVFSNGSDTFYLKAKGGKWYGFGENEYFRFTQQNHWYLDSIARRMNGRGEKLIYEPVPSQVEVDWNEPYRHFGVEGFPVEHAETVLQGHQKQYFGRNGSWEKIVSLYETGDILFLQRRGTAVPSMLYPSIGRAIDFAWSAHGGQMIVATRDGEILWGDPSYGVEGLDRFRICENVSWKL